jgi:hypothetical protein
MMRPTRSTPAKFIVPLLMSTSFSSKAIERSFSAAAAATMRCSSRVSVAFAAAAGATESAINVAHSGSTRSSTCIVLCFTGDLLPI